MYLLVHNPRASHARPADEWQRFLHRAGIDADVQAAGDLQTLPAFGRDDCLVIAGGDGTLRRYVDWCAERGCRVGVLPAGTGNDFARGMGLPLAPDAAARTIAQGKARAFDVARVNDRPFLNVAHIGFGSEISRHVAPTVKNLWGRLAYLRTLFTRLKRLRGFHATIRSENETISGRWLQISVANGCSFGGGQRFFGASPVDGELDLLAVRPRPVPELFRVWLRAHLTGRPPDDPAIVKRRARRFGIHGRPGLQVTGDGDTLSELPATFVVDAGALRVIVPVSHADAASTDDPGPGDA